MNEYLRGEGSTFTAQFLGRDGTPWSGSQYSVETSYAMGAGDVRDQTLGPDGKINLPTIIIEGFIGLAKAGENLSEYSPSEKFDRPNTLSYTGKITFNGGHGLISTIEFTATATRTGGSMYRGGIVEGAVTGIKITLPTTIPKFK